MFNRLCFPLQFALRAGVSFFRRWSPLVILLTILPSLAAEVLPIKEYTTADGLARDQVHRIMTDSHGFVWFATSEGLSRFNGYEFVNYGIDQGLPHQSVRDILETRNTHDLWVATAQGVAKFNPEGAARFVTYRSGEGALSNTFNTIYEDQRGRIWCGSDGGLFRLEGAGENWQMQRIALGQDFDYSVERAVNSIIEDRQGVMWAGTDAGLFQIKNNGEDITRYTEKDGLPAIQIKTLYQDSKRRIWAGTRAGLSLLATDDLTSRTSIVMRNFTTRDGLLSNYISALVETGDETLWVGNLDGGLNSLSIVDAITEGRFRTYGAANGLRDKNIEALATDASDNLWIGTESAGAIKINHSGAISFHTADGLSDDRIASIFENQRGQLMVLNPALNILHDNRFFSYQTKLPGSLTNGWGWSQISFQDREGDWWMTTTGGVYRYAADPKTGLPVAHPKATYLTHADGTGVEIFRLYEDSRGDVWFGSFNVNGAGLYRWERATDTLKIYPAADYHLPLTSPTAFRETAEGDLWIGFYEGGLARYRAGQFTRFADSDGAPGEVIRGLYVDTKGRLWIASSRDGVSRVDDPHAENPKFIRMTIHDGLASNHVTCITEDRWGCIYIGTGRGLDRLDPITGYIKHYTTSDGLADNYINVSYTDREGSLWFGTLRGLTRLIPQPDEPANSIPILIGSLRIAGVQYPLPDLGSTAVSGIELTARQNQLQIEYFGLSSGEKILYQHKLEGADLDWSAPSTDRAVNYANLEPGNYRFQVRAFDARHGVNQNPASVTFQILPPIWRRWWFLSLAFIFVGSVIYALDRYRAARVKELDHALASAIQLSTQLTEQQSELHQANRFLELEYAVTRVLAESASPHEAAPGILQNICESGGWEVGAIWDVDEEIKALRCVEVWSDALLDAGEFAALTRANIFSRGEGIPGRVWETAAPVWISDISQEVNFPRLQSAYAVGLRSAFGFPILLDREVVGVLELFSRETRVHDPTVVEMLTGIGGQIGQLLERKRAEEVIRESENRFRTLAETASDAIITINEKSIVIFVNQAAEKIFGYSISEMIGSDLTMLMPEYLRHFHRRGLERYVQTGLKHTAWSAVELPGRHKSGQEIPLELSFGEFTKNNQRFFTGIARDISERKRAEEAIRKNKEERLRELERVRKRIATDLHDDIGSSLTQISILSEVVRQQSDGKDKSVSEKLNMIATASRELVDSMSEIVWAINPNKDHLSDLSGRMRRFASDTLSARNIDFKFTAQVGDEDISVGANIRREIFLIFKECINNIVKHAECTRVEIKLWREENTLQLELRDDGKGYEPLSRSEGHGLASMRERTHGLGGDIEMISESGVGSAVKLRVPLG